MDIARARGTGLPILFLRSRCALDMKLIGHEVIESLHTMQRFMSAAGIVPAGPPLTVYRGWNTTETTIEVGYPVAEADLAKADSIVVAGHSPTVDAVMTVHHGPYALLAGTYAELERQMGALGIATGTVTWEIYPADPLSTPDQERVVDVYIGISSEDARKLGS
jgi:effector-binding domain-containing protein